MNLDGRADVVTVHGGWLAAGVYLQQPNGTLAGEDVYAIPYASQYNPHGLAVGDINSDGAPDIALADYNNGLVLLRSAAAAPRGAADLGVHVKGSAATLRTGRLLRRRLQEPRPGHVERLASDQRDRALLAALRQHAGLLRLGSDGDLLVRWGAGGDDQDRPGPRDRERARDDRRDRGRGRKRADPNSANDEATATISVR